LGFPPPLGNGRIVPSLSPLSGLPGGYLALPAPASSRLGARGGRDALADDSTLPPELTVAVQPVPPVTRQTKQSQGSDEDGGGTDSSADGGSATNRSRRAGSGQGSAGTGGFADQDNRPRVQVLGAQASRQSSGFVTQRLSQESLGSGLHIEPWQAALSSYKAAAALPAPAQSTQTLFV
jgi:hypothetical protein